MANKTLSKSKPATPVKVGNQQERQIYLLKVLRDDMNYDVVRDIIDTMAMIRRAKRIKPLEKYRLLKDYQLSLLSFCFPKIKVQENVGDNTGKGVTFNINIEGDKEPPLKRAGSTTTAQAKKGGVTISIPAKKLSKDTVVLESDG